MDGHDDFRVGRTARTGIALAQRVLVPDGDCSVADRSHGRCNSGTKYSGVWTFRRRFCAVRKVEDSSELLFDVLPLFNPLFQSPTPGARHNGTNTSHYFAQHDFVSHLPDKFRALSTELLVWWGGRQMGRHCKGRVPSVDGRGVLPGAFSERKCRPPTGPPCLLYVLWHGYPQAFHR